jgi:cysteine desulfurase
MFVFPLLPSGDGCATLFLRLFSALVKTIYFDYNATTPLDPAVREAMMPFFGDVFGNPSSVHHVGCQARALLDDARDRVAKVWGAKPSEVVFTSGGTESNNLAVFGTARLLRPKGRHLITSAIEHHSVLHSFRYLALKEGYEVTYLPVDAEGLVSVQDLEKALRPDTTFVSIMAANNETGSIQPVAALGDLCRSRGVVFHTDTTQYFGKLPFSSIQQFNADLVSACSHKFHGPKGAGALFIKSPLLPDPIIFGGGHENERRAGTENVAGIIGFAEATERFVKNPVFPPEQLLALTRSLIESARSMERVTFRGSPLHRLSNTVAFSVEGCDSTTVLTGLDLAGVCASGGSACSAGSIEPSHVLSAMGASNEAANSLIRFSLGRDSTMEEVQEVSAVLRNVINRALQV